MNGKRQIYSCQECDGCPHKKECIKGNHSIQAEGAFGDLKQDCGFRRFLCRGTVNVKAEAILSALARNMRKLHNKIQADRTGTHLFPLKKSA